MLRRIFLALCVFWFPIEAFAQGPLLWELQEDIHGRLDAAQAVTLSGKAAIVLGNAGVSQNGTDESDLFIQALGRSTGAIQWNDQAFLSIGAVEPLFAATRQNRTYALGTLREPNDPRSGFLVRAYDVPTGALLWENTWHPGQGVDTDHPTGIFATPTQVIVVGYGENDTRDGTAALVKVYDSVTGAALWENRDSRIGVNEVIAWAVAANRAKVFVAGTTSISGSASTRDLFVRAFNAVSGDVEWEISRPTTSPTTIKLASGRLLVGGAAANSSYLAAFSVGSGALLWEDTAPVFPGFTTDMAVRGFRLASAVQTANGFAVRTHDLSTGSVEWEDHPTIAAGSRGRITAVALNDNNVYAVGSFGEDFGSSEFMVRAYDANGTLMWDDRSHPSLETTAVDVALGPFRLFVVGYTSNGTASRDFLIRAYDARVPSVGP